MINLTLLDALDEKSLPNEYQDLRGKKLLVTGSAGFIGGALFKRLAEYDLDVVGTVLYQDEANQLRDKGYIWSWTNPSLSLVLRQDESKAIVLNRRNFRGWQPFNPKVNIPDISKYYSK